MDKRWTIYLVCNGYEFIGDTNSLPIPRVGEHILFKGKNYEVSHITYDLDTESVNLQAFPY